MSLTASTIAPATPSRGLRVTMARREAIVALGFLAPGLLMFVIFTLGPAIFSFFAGFTKWNGLSEPIWVGLDNYVQLAQDHLFITSVVNTVLYTVLFVVMVLASSVAIAMLLNSKARGTPVARFLWVLPFVTDMISVSMVWTWLYHYRFGVVNYLLGLVGIPPQSWLGDPRLAMLSLVILSVWRWTGYYAIILLAGLQGVPPSLYDAAYVDGATGWQRLRHVTLPMLSPTIFFVMIMAMMSSFQVFEQMWVMTKGGPNDTTISVAMFLYIQGFQFLNMGYASAVAWVLFFIVFALTVINWRVRRRWVFEG
ncbi:MAG: carbohydrate ABC transporter permease [Devosia sp.]